MAWEDMSSQKTYVSSTSVQDDLEKEVEWFEPNLSLLLNKHAKVLYVSPFSKRWWNDKVADARKIWARGKKCYGKDLRYKEELKKACNSYYRVIRVTKRVCWQNFLQGKDTRPDEQSDDKNRCWTAFR